MDDNLTARAKLIFERDKNSSLFLRTADFYFRQGNSQFALSTLQTGLVNFPEHPLALILLGKIHHSLGNISLSEEFFKKASEILDSTKTFEFYKQEFKLPGKQVSPFDYSRGNIFIDSTDELVFEEESIDNKSHKIDDNLIQIADNLMSARIEQNSNSTVNEYTKKEYEPNKSVLATETFANIYLSQGQINEAIKVFEVLADRNPAKRDFYLDKIRKLKS